MKEILNHLFAKNTLDSSEAKKIMLEIGQGQYTESEIASFLTVYMMRKITAPELSGFREALLDLSVKVDLSEYNTIDVCGTGGDEKNTFNISTLTSFVLAGAGIKVVKHGNYAVSSAVGSSNVLEAMGYKFSNDLDKIKKEIEETNICYLHAPFFHPAMKYVAPVRKALKLKTFFNLLGPMVNPARPQNQIVGVYNEEVQDLYHEVYKSNPGNYNILYSLDGYDEISLTGHWRSLTKKGEVLYSPEQIGLSKVKPEELFGGDTIDDAIKIFKDVLNGLGTKAQVSAVLANTAFAITCYYPEKNIEEAMNMARESIDSKNALGALNKLIELQ